MTRSTDLLDRVAAANPMPTHAPLSSDERREADELLAHVLSTPPHDVTARRPRRPWTRWFILAGAAAAVIIAVVATSMVDRGPSIVDRAYAAVSERSLYHVVRSTTIEAPAWFTPSGSAVPRGAVTESWYDLRQPAYHYVQYELRDGRRRLVLEGAGSPDGTTIRESADQKPRTVDKLEGTGPPDIERFDPTAQFKKAYRDGNIRQAGTAIVGGRHAHRLIIEHDPQPPVINPELIVHSSRTIALFDAQTMHPIESVDESDIEANGRRGTVITRTTYTTFETLPRTPENLAKLQIPQP